MMMKAEGKEERNVVVELVEFAMRVVHEDLASFFEEHCHLWDYDEAEMKALFQGSGESLEQYEVYRQYVELITDQLDRFASVSGLGSQKEVFAQVEEAIERDNARRSKLMKEIRELFSRWKGAKHNEEDDKAAAAAKDEDDKPPPVMLFSQPIGLEFLLDSVIKLSEYDTLRMIMIMKVRERKMIAELRKRGATRKEEAERRADILRGRPDSGDLKDEYFKLKTRLEELTPHNKQLHESLDEGMRHHGDLFDDPIADPACYKTPSDHLIHLSALASASISSDLELKAAALADDKRATHVDWLTLLHDAIDRICEDIEARVLQNNRRCAVTGGALSPPPSDAKL